jgi:acyl-CoA synthetase (AMP-forming)/AMP-acid ligase II
MSYRDLSAAVDQLAGRLAATSGGYAPGRSLAGARIGIVAPNVPALVIAMLAVWRSGAAVVPLNARLREYELGRILLDAEVSVLIAVSAYRGYSFVSLMPRLLPQLPSLRSCLFVDSMGEVEDQIEQPAAAAPEAALDAQFGAILYTSGTTGMPKGALVKHERELSGAHQMATVLGLTPEDTCVFVVPMTHAFGMTCLLSSIASGSRAVLVDSTFSPEPMVNAIKQHKATILHGSPSVFISLLKAAFQAGDSLGRSTLRSGFVAGAACPTQILQELDNIGARILNLFGMTEIGAAACCRPEDPPQARYTSSGHPLPGYEFRIVSHGASSSENDAAPGEHLSGSPDCVRPAEGIAPTTRVVPAGEASEVEVRGPYVSPGYYRQPEQTAQAFDRDPQRENDPPWFRTGDLGSVDEQGYVRISGRAKEVIQVGGLNVFPAEVEGFLLTHPDVVQAAVIGVPHESMGEALQAFVVARSGSGLTPSALLQFARASIAGYKLPYAITMLPALPALPSGKPDRAALAALSSEP